MSEALTYEWVQVAGVRLPVHLPLTLVPLRPLAAELGLRYECLVSAAGRFPNGQALATHAVQGPGQEKPKPSVCIDADKVWFLGVAARPRAGTPGLEKLCMALNDVFRAFNVPTGAEFVGRRYGAADMLDEPKMLKIVALAQAGKTFSEIGTEFRKSETAIRQFLAGVYRTTAAAAFYKKYGKPGRPNRNGLQEAQEAR